jgi:hypothetical protein
MGEYAEKPGLSEWGDKSGVVTDFPSIGCGCRVRPVGADFQSHNQGAEKRVLENENRSGFGDCQGGLILQYF